MLVFEEKHADMKKRVDESNNYSDLRKPWFSFKKIHGDMEHEISMMSQDESSAEADKAKLTKKRCKTRNGSPTIKSSSV